MLPPRELLNSAPILNATTHAVFGVAALAGASLLAGTEPPAYAYPVAVAAAWLPDVLAGVDALLLPGDCDALLDGELADGESSVPPQAARIATKARAKAHARTVTGCPRGPGRVAVALRA